MANPAELLLEIFETWNNPTQTARAARDDESLETHRRAVRLLGQIEDLLDTLDAVGKRTRVSRTYFPSWVHTCFHYPGAWEGPNTGRIDQTLIDHLENLADALDGIVPRCADDGLSKLAEYLDTVVAALDDDDTIPKVVYLHAQAVVAHVRKCIDDYERMGDIDLRQALEQLLAVLAQLHATSKRPEVWKERMNTFVWPFIVGNASSLAATGELYLMLGS